MEEELIRSEEEYVDLAYKLYAGWCTRNGYIYNHPSQFSGWVNGKTIEPWNVNGTLARFKLDKKGHLHQVK